MEMTTLRLNEEDRERTLQLFTRDAARPVQRPPRPDARPVVAVVLAAGSGTRLGAARPKQLLEAGGRTLLEHAVAAFQHSPLVDEICLVVSPAVRPAAEALARDGGYGKLRTILCGGAERADSTRAAVGVYAGKDVFMLVHDAARPVVRPGLIARVCEALAGGADGVCPVLPVADTILALDSAGRPVAQPDRSQLARVQTPQGFRSGVLEEAFRRAGQDAGFRATDDFGVVMRYLPEARLSTVEGEESCFKVTYADDLARLESMLST